MANLILVTEKTVSPTGIYCLFKDTTGTTSATAYGVGGNDTYSDIKGVRIKIGTATTLNAFTTLLVGDSFTIYTEYQKTVGASSTINGKTMVIGSVFVSVVSGITIPSGDEWVSTGYYVPNILATWLPTAAQVALSLSINQMGQSGSILEDNEYQFEYEVYDTVFTTSTAAVADQIYMCLSGTCTYNGDTFYAGQVFAAVGTSNIVPALASSVVKFYASATSYAALIFSLETAVLLNIQLKGFNTSSQYNNDIFGVQASIESIYNSSSTENVDLTGCKELIDSLTNQVIGLANNN